MADLMIDIEALSNQPNSVILTIGAQQFDPSLRGWITAEQMDMISQQAYQPYCNIRVDVDEQLALGRVTDERTVQWWSTQDPAAIEDAFSEEGRVSLRTALLQLSTLAYPCKRVWSKGPVYDITMLEHAYAMAELPVPWKFWTVRDARTVYSLCPKIQNRTNGHIALDDCRNQILMLQDAFAELGVETLR